MSLKQPMSKRHISRRDFLKLSGYGLTGMFLPNLSLNPPTDVFDTLQGRVIDRILWSHEEPNRKSKRKKLYWHDLVFRITNSTISGNEAGLDGGGIHAGGPLTAVMRIANVAITGNVAGKGANADGGVIEAFRMVEVAPEL